MKYDVRFSCGHTHTVELFGKFAGRERKIKWYEEFGVCPDCYAEQKRIEMAVAAEKQGLECVEMLYRDYKRDYSDCKAVPGSYNGESKTIKVWCNIKQYKGEDTL